MAHLDESILEKLLDALWEVEGPNSRFDDSEFNYDSRLPSSDPLIQKIVGYANVLLIDDEGNPKFEAMDELHYQHGYFVFPGEKDRFGWLTACLQTEKGVIVFG